MEQCNCTKVYDSSTYSLDVIKSCSFAIIVCSPDTPGSPQFTEAVNRAIHQRTSENNIHVIPVEFSSTSECQRKVYKNLEVLVLIKQINELYCKIHSLQKMNECHVNVKSEEGEQLQQAIISLNNSDTDVKEHYMCTSSPASQRADLNQKPCDNIKLSPRLQREWHSSINNADQLTSSYEKKPLLSQKVFSPLEEFSLLARKCNNSESSLAETDFSEKPVVRPKILRQTSLQDSQIGKIYKSNSPKSRTRNYSEPMKSYQQSVSADVHISSRPTPVGNSFAEDSDQEMFHLPKPQDSTYSPSRSRHKTQSKAYHPRQTRRSKSNKTVVKTGLPVTETAAPAQYNRLRELCSGDSTCDEDLNEMHASPQYFRSRHSVPSHHEQFQTTVCHSASHRDPHFFNRSPNQCNLSSEVPFSYHSLNPYNDMQHRPYDIQFHSDPYAENHRGKLQVDPYFYQNNHYSTNRPELYLRQQIEPNVFFDDSRGIVPSHYSSNFDRTFVDCKHPYEHSPQDMLEMSDNYTQYQRNEISQPFTFQSLDPKFPLYHDERNTSDDINSRLSSETRSASVPSDLGHQGAFSEPDDLTDSEALLNWYAPSECNRSIELSQNDLMDQLELINRNSEKETSFEHNTSKTCNEQ